MEEMGKELAKKALEILTGTQAFVIEQAPDFMRQILAYKMAMNILWFIISSISIGALLLTADRVYKWGKEHHELFFPCMLWVIGGFVSMTIWICTLTDIIQIHFAPKVYLLEYFAYLLKSK